MVLGGSDPVAANPYHAPLPLHPPLVSFIALLGTVGISLRLGTCAGDKERGRRNE